ncbi:MAG: disulfide bond formation protein B [Rhodospirillales bacterium]
MSLLTNPDRLLGPFLLAVGVGSLAFALIAQYIFGLEPCLLCLVQRVPYAAVALIGGFLMVRKPGNLGLARAAWIAVAIFAAGGLVAVYHTGVEQAWWASAVCGGPAPADMSFDAMMAGATQKAAKSCDQVDWTLFGLSMATYNIFVSFALAAVTGLVAHRLGKSA